MNTKGFTTVELITTFGLVMIIALLLMELVLSLKKMYVNSAIRATLLNRQAIMTKNIYEDFSNKQILLATNCGENCLLFIFDDSSESMLRVDKDNKLFTYGTYTVKLDDGSSFGDIDVSSKTISGVSAIKNDSMIVINIPVQNKLVDGDFGVNVVYQYNSRESSITDVAFDNTTTNDDIFLKGETDMHIEAGSNFQDLGYFTLVDGKLVNNDGRVIVTGSVDTSSTGVYELTYSLYIGGNLKSTKIRTVTVY